MMDAILTKYPVAFFMRHAHRPEIPNGSYGHELALTSEGKDEAQKLAHTFRPYLVETFSSPVPRCLETARYFQEHSKTGALIQHQCLGAPGVYIEDEKIAGPFFLQMTPEEIAHDLIRDGTLPGFSKAMPASRDLLMTMLSSMNKGPGLYPFVSHDYIISVFLNSLLHEQECEKYWPTYLEGVFVWMQKGSINLLFRSETYTVKDC